MTKLGLKSFGGGGGGLETSIHLPGYSQSVQGRTRGSLRPEKERFEADLPSQGSGSKGKEK